MRHSRVTAVWDDEPVPAMPLPPDQTPPLGSQPPPQQVQASLETLADLVTHGEHAACILWTD